MAGSRRQGGGLKTWSGRISIKIYSNAPVAADVEYIDLHVISFVFIYIYM